ncbi:hypothetical protein [Thalassobacillus sp. B23F22_16]|uniref:hypothetical protein n=1 Tax=Thalassobacillus sp. B23F22_16 TaxID=3459513 RepID=UPI00373ECF9B
MWDRREEKKKKTRRARKKKGDYTFWDGFFDLLFWVPELLILPIRLIFFLFRGLGKLLKDAFDFIP